MSLLSRNTGGGRRSVAKLAAVFAGTLLTYLVVTAIPAMAVSTCASGTTVNADDTLNVAVGTDDHLVLATDAIAGADFEFSVNGGAFAACSGTVGTNISWIHITGSNAGNETLTLFHPQTWSNYGPSFNSSTTVDLGNGNDTLVWEYGGLAAPPIADPATNDEACLGGAPGVLLVGDQNCGGVADIRVDNAETFTVNGGDGNDTIDAGNLGGIDANTDAILTFAGENIPGSDTPATVNFTLNGGNGDDLLVSGDGNDNFLGGPGQDGVSYEAASGGVTVDLAAATGTGMGNDTLSDVQDVQGSLNDDTILGNSLDNNLFGDEGDDVVDGREGNDGGTPSAVLPIPDGVTGGDDDDSLTGGTGDDIVQGQAGDDVVHEDAAVNGTDALEGGPGGGCDEIDYASRTGAVTVNEQTGTGWGETGELDTGAGFELLNTGSGNDTIVGDNSDEIAKPGAGDDSVDLDGDNGPDPCGIGFDWLDESDAAGAVTFDLITGTATGNGTDTFENVEGYISGAGDDTLLIGDTSANGNTLENWSSDGGIDTIDGSAATTNLGLFLVDYGFDCSADPAIGCLEVENAIGGTGNDVIVGNGLANNLQGGDGADDIEGLNGNDTVEGGQGNDSMDGGAGADTLIYVNAPSAEDIDTQLGFASGGDGEDAIGFFEIVKGSDFNDTINAGQNSVSANNRIFGRGGADLITGSNSADLLVGGGADDTIRAGGGDDTLKGQKGNDLLVGGKGFDIGFGGKGNDKCKSIEQKHSC